MLPIFEETPGSAQQGVGGDDNNSPLSNVDWEPAVGCCGGGWEYEMLCEQQGQTLWQLLSWTQHRINVSRVLFYKTFLEFFFSLLSQHCAHALVRPIAHFVCGVTHSKHIMLLYKDFKQGRNCPISTILSLLSLRGCCRHSHSQNLGTEHPAIILPSPLGLIRPLCSFCLTLKRNIIFFPLQVTSQSIVSVFY